MVRYRSVLTSICSLPAGLTSQVTLELYCMRLVFSVHQKIRVFMYLMQNCNSFERKNNGMHG